MLVSSSPAFRYRSTLVTTGVLVLVSLISGCKKQAQEETMDSTSQKSSVAKIPPKPVPAFDAAWAMASVNQQVAFGPRVPNTAPHQKALDYFKTELSACTPNVVLQDFQEPAYSGPPLKLTNIIASFNPQATQRILLLTHYDSRPWADEDPIKANKTKPVPAANDGASGSAVLLELARQMKDNPPPIGVDILLDDGEDYGKYDVDSLNKYFLGVKYFVSTKPAGFNPMFGVLLDMVGDQNAQFTQEGYSVVNAATYTTEIWRAAADLGLSTFKQERGAPISDDHTPLLKAGIPTVDIIDNELVGHASSDPNRKYWHTTDDLPKHISQETLGQVGKLLLTLIYDRIPRDMGTPMLP